MIPDDYFRFEGPFGELLVVKGESFRRAVRDSSPIWRAYQLLPVREARSALYHSFECDRARLERLCKFVCGAVYESRQDMIDVVRQALGLAWPGQPDPSPLARVYVARLNMDAIRIRALHDEPVELPESKPLIDKDPRGYLAVEAVDEDGKPVENITCQMITGGDAFRRWTDSEGRAAVDRISQGRCLIRLPELDGKLWRAEGTASELSRDNAAPRWHVVERGECLARIAREHGLADWQSIWSHPKNEPLRKRRKSPHVLRIGDEVLVPAPTVHEIVVPTDTTYRIVVQRGKLKVRIRLQDLAGRPLSGRTYRYRYELLQSEVEKSGSKPTEADGWLEEVVPLEVRNITITLAKSRVSFRRRLGALAAVRDHDTGKVHASGVQEQLVARGYDPGPRASALTESAREALAAFQANELESKDPSGEPDPETLAALERPDGEVVTLSKLRLGTLTGPLGFWRFEALPEHAFVVLRRVVDQGPAAPLQAAIVGQDGLLYELDPADRASRTSDTVLQLLAPERYRLWWMVDHHLYAEALENPALLETEGSLVEVRQYHQHQLVGLVERRVAFRNDDGHFFTDTESVCHAISEHLLHRHVFHGSREMPFFDVTPPCIRALYTVELMQWYMLNAHEASANNLASFQHAAGMIHAAEKGLKDLSLEARATELFPSPAEREVFELFREYTWRCVATAMPPNLFMKSIEMHEGPSDLPQGGVPNRAGGVLQTPEADWLIAATELRQLSASKKHGPAVHPYFRGASKPSHGLVQEGVVLTPSQQRLIRDYYECYRFGAELKTATFDGTSGFEGRTYQYRERMAARMQDLDQTSERVYERAKALFDQHCHPDTFFATVASCYPRDDELIDRYVNAAAFCASKWWRQLARREEESAPSRGSKGEFVTKEWPYWKTFKARMKPIAELSKGAGKIAKLLGERLAAYKLSLTEAQEMLGTIGRLDLTLEGRDVDAQRHVIRTERALVRLEPSGEAGEVRISLADGQRTPGAPRSVSFRFVRREVAPPSADPTGTHVQRWRPVVQAGEYYIEVPACPKDLEDPSRWSKPFSLLAEAVNVAIAAKTLIGEAKAKDDLFATFDIAKGIVGVVESFPDAVRAMGGKLEKSTVLKGASGRVKALKGASTTLSRVDGVLKIYKGLEILFSESSEMQYELRHGRPVNAELQRIAGMAYIVAGSASVVEIVGAAASAAGVTEILGCSALVLAGFSATPWGLVLSVGGSVLTAVSLLVFDFAQPWNTRLMEVERALDAAAKDEIRGDRFKVSLCLEELREAVERAWKGA